MEIRVNGDQIIGGELDGAAAAVFDMRTLPLMLVIHPDSSVSVRGLMGYGEAVAALRYVADRMERDALEAAVKEERDDEPAADDPA